MPKLLILQGLPASGKTTIAKAMVAADPIHWKRVNKDDIRKDLTSRGWEWSHEREKTDVLPRRDEEIRWALMVGYNVISDDTNFGSHVTALSMLVERLPIDVTVEVRCIDTPLDECLRRNATRPEAERVPAHVIRTMAAKYCTPTPVPVVIDPALPWVVLCDLDGTLALTGGRRSPYDQEHCDEDDINEPVAWLVQILQGLEWDYTPVWFISGREDKYRKQTHAFLNRAGLRVDELFMRPTGDTRKDYLIKGELYDTHIRGKANVRFVLDDRDQVVAYWRSIGLTCLQVAPGAF